MKRLIGTLAAVVLVATAAASASPAVARPERLHHACGGRIAPHQVRCFALWRGTDTGMRTAAATLTPPSHGYGPADIASAYQLDTSTGAGQTIAIVDAYDNPNVEKDLGVYRATWWLPPCTTANGR